MTTIRRFLAALTHSGPGYDPAPLPQRGDVVEQWLKTRRDQHVDSYGRSPAWYTLDDLLDTYRLHADTDIPLGEHACTGQAVGDCDCLETPAGGNQ